MKCPSCGAENEPGSKFCQSCGANTETSGPSASTGGPTPPPPPPFTQPPPSAGPKGSTELDIGGWLSKAFNEVFADFVNYLLIGVVVGLVSGITFGILAGPLMGGALSVVRRKLRGQGAVDVSKVFNVGFEKFLPAFLIVFIPAIVLGIVAAIPIIGGIVDLVAMGLLMPIWAISLHYIYEENMEFMDAGKKAWEIASKNPMMYWLFGIVTAIVSGIGRIACGIGAFVTIPVGLVMMALMLENHFPRK
jgi:hypothetical protein